MTITMVEIGKRPPEATADADADAESLPPLGAELPGTVGDDEVIIVDDLDGFLEATMCNCSASDDNPY
ncbi:hypothetical protein OG772_20555 [Streptomyces sp. NBC_01321]|uniref:hypothetical protein n=1 Tax=Streptomyces sp. NBC_01321 TaxID=2903825 RepID=UPI002E145B85|nr:hypothetical protein OG772_20555 [Streptomyces sp. NBC_01321]